MTDPASLSADDCHVALRRLSDALLRCTSMLKKHEEAYYILCEFLHGAPDHLQAPLTEIISREATAYATGWTEVIAIGKEAEAVLGQLAQHTAVENDLRELEAGEGEKT